MSTEAQLSKIKAWYMRHYPLCGYCGHRVYKNCQLSHIIRRSYSKDLQTVKLNLCLAHDSCHSLWDDSPYDAQFLPRAAEILYIVYLLDPQYFYQIADNYPLLHPIFERFPEVGITELDHYGELIQLTYLYA